tara:strand:- start:366 stop:1412 length:1047 start_codon:yes stop_codon:yes gene_type:complete
MKIGKYSIGDNQPVFIIAEAGINHNGKMDIAYDLIDAARDSGADAVKFQTFITENIIHPNCPRPSHEEENIPENISHFDLVKKWELPFESYEKLKNYSENNGLIFISTPYDIESAELLIELQCDAIKIASSDMSNYPLLDKIRHTQIPIILSTGMNYWYEIVDSINFIKEKTNKLCVLKCTSNYPASYEGINLNGLTRLKDQYPNSLFGFSDHTEGFEASIASLGFGVRIIEKHLTLEKKSWGPDHKASLDPNQFKNFVHHIKNAEKTLGDRNWEVQEEETSQRNVMQKGTYVNKDIKKGTAITMDDVIFLRPKNGISPKEFFLEYNNKIINTDLRFRDELSAEYFKN